MGRAYESIMAGLTEAVEDVQDTEKKLKRHTISVVPVKEYSEIDWYVPEGFCGLHGSV